MFVCSHVLFYFILLLSTHFPQSALFIRKKTFSSSIEINIKINGKRLTVMMWSWQLWHMTCMPFGNLATLPHLNRKFKSVRIFEHPLRFPNTDAFTTMHASSFCSVNVHRLDTFVLMMGLARVDWEKNPTLSPWDFPAKIKLKNRNRRKRRMLYFTGRYGVWAKQVEQPSVPNRSCREWWSSKFHHSSVIMWL